MIVLDTNVISELMKAEPHPHVQDWFARLTTSPLTTTAISVAEITYGLERLPEGKRKQTLTNAFLRLLDLLRVLPLDEAAAIKAGIFRSQREGSRNPSIEADMMIAGIVAEAGATLATRNIKDFEGLPITLSDPWAAN